jgi:tetratricopeptide (TPR) repeat protein
MITHARRSLRLTLLCLALGIGFGLSCGDKKADLKDLKSDGQKAFLNQEYRKARDFFLKGLAIAPSDRDLLYYTGLCYKRDFIYDSALSYLKRADLLYPNDRELNLELYAVANATQSWQVAVDCINVLVETGDPLDNYLEQLAVLNVKLEQPLNVVYYLRRLCALRPDSALYALQLANGLISVDSLESASEVIDSAIAKFGEIDEFLATRATIGAYRGKYSQSEKTFRDLIARDTVGAAHYKLNLANVLSMQKERDKKLEALSLYKEIRPKLGAGGAIDSLIDTLEKELR